MGPSKAAAHRTVPPRLLRASLHTLQQLHPRISSHPEIVNDLYNLREGPCDSHKFCFLDLGRLPPPRRGRFKSAEAARDGPQGILGKCFLSLSHSPSCSWSLRSRFFTSLLVYRIFIIIFHSRVLLKRKMTRESP